LQQIVCRHGKNGFNAVRALLPISLPPCDSQTALVHAIGIPTRTGQSLLLEPGTHFTAPGRPVAKIQRPDHCISLEDLEGRNPDVAILRPAHSDVTRIVAPGNTFP
jgi:hypothetical protein